jgi:hypothetical protein
MRPTMPQGQPTPKATLRSRARRTLHLRVPHLRPVNADTKTTDTVAAKYLPPAQTTDHYLAQYL